MKLIFYFFIIPTLLFSENNMFSFIAPGDLSLGRLSSDVSADQILSEEIQTIIDLLYTIATDNQNDIGNGIMVGLAAPQIGIMKRIILVDVGVGSDWKDYGNLVAFINPQITWFSEEISWGIEGCFSVDSHLDGKVPRSESIRISAFDRGGNRVDTIVSGFTARIFQHEIDHLNGIRFPDRVGENGVLHWIPDNQYKLYLEKWESWPHICPWQLWLDMKEGITYEFPIFKG